jgi:hypothetical protein
LYPERLTNQITWSKPDPPPNALHTAFTHLKAVEATLVDGPLRHLKSTHATTMCIQLIRKVVQD